MAHEWVLKWINKDIFRPKFGKISSCRDNLESQNILSAQIQDTKIFSYCKRL